jgi:integrase-like protein
VGAAYVEYMLDAGEQLSVWLEAVFDEQDEVGEIANSRARPVSVGARKGMELLGELLAAVYDLDVSGRRAVQAKERLAAGEQWHETDLVFTTANGRAVDPRNFLRSWHKILQQVGLSRRPLHAARHAAASLMLSEGVPLKVVQETLGHSTIRLTADIYGHLMPGDAERAANAVDRALGA